MATEHLHKRRKLSNDETPSASLVRMQRAAFLSSMSRDISPPPSSRATPDVEVLDARSTKPVSDKHTSDEASKHELRESLYHATASNGSKRRPKTPQRKVIPSPFTLTKIRDLPASHNVDTVNLHDILGNPIIREAWIFNFCFDIDWLMQFFDSDVRSLVSVKIIHGSWRNEDGNRIAIEDACRRWSNVENSKAYLPDQFGTHHSKMFVLFTHDDHAEVVIHTANMLMKDWTNMTQAVWRSGLLPKADKKNEDTLGTIGSGERFKYDLLAYLREYKNPCQALVKQLQEYDFTSVRGALVASVPSKIANSQLQSTKDQHLWGYPQLREVLSQIQPASHDSSKEQNQKLHLVAQVSSIASLPNGWLDNLRTVASITAPTAPKNNKTQPFKSQRPGLSIIYPTPTNVATSLDGYSAGGSIHMKAQSATHMNQINALRPYLCQWTEGPMEKFRMGRDRAAPHVKTYVMFNREPTNEALLQTSSDQVGSGGVHVEWALLTSANLSVQAWGSLPRNKTSSKPNSSKSPSKPASGSDDGVAHIQSFEIGVLVWPALYDEDFDEHTSPSIRENNGHGPVTNTDGGLRLRVGGKKERTRIVPAFKDSSFTTKAPVSIADASSTVIRIDDEIQLTKKTVSAHSLNAEAGDHGFAAHGISGDTERTVIDNDAGKDDGDAEKDDDDDDEVEDNDMRIVELRLPYDLPLTPYKADDMPWSPAGRYMIPDSRGAVWDGGGGGR